MNSKEIKYLNAVERLTDAAQELAQLSHAKLADEEKQQAFIDGLYRLEGALKDLKALLKTP